MLTVLLALGALWLAGAWALAGDGAWDRGAWVGDIRHTLDDNKETFPPSIIYFLATQMLGFFSIWNEIWYEGNDMLLDLGIPISNTQYSNYPILCVDLSTT